MSELQKDIFNMIVILDNQNLELMKSFVEELLDKEILKLDPEANLNEMDLYDKISALKAYKILNDNQPTISYEDALKELEVDE